MFIKTKLGNQETLLVV